MFIVESCRGPKPRIWTPVSSGPRAGDLAARTTSSVQLHCASDHATLGLRVAPALRPTLPPTGLPGCPTLLCRPACACRDQPAPRTCLASQPSRTAFPSSACSAATVFSIAPTPACFPPAGLHARWSSAQNSPPSHTLGLGSTCLPRGASLPAHPHLQPFPIKTLPSFLPSTNDN